ncbi:hypothetical protein C8Q80DRAFT_340613 [Daedaleopsis nitida]|nr:hypothetical protein C8Q80DRAFT_340613 [Daedaleopsis nitida]
MVCTTPPAPDSAALCAVPCAIPTIERHGTRLETRQASIREMQFCRYTRARPLDVHRGSCTASRSSARTTTSAPHRSLPPGPRHCSLSAWPMIIHSACTEPAVTRTPRESPGGGVWRVAASIWARERAHSVARTPPRQTPRVCADTRRPGTTSKLLGVSYTWESPQDNVVQDLTKTDHHGLHEVHLNVSNRSNPCPPSSDNVEKSAMRVISWASGAPPTSRLSDTLVRHADSSRAQARYRAG